LRSSFTVAKTASKAENNILGRITDYLSDTRAELRKVTWPTRQAAWNLTLIVLGVTIFMSLVLGAADWLFSIIMKGIVTGNPIGAVAAVVVVAVGGAAVYFSQRD
jgi:preprotein translocase subunit SecE